MIAGHPFWHHILMVFYLEVVNFAWIFFGLGVGFGGWIAYDVADQAVIRLAVGLPIAITGSSVVLFKLHDVLLTLLRPKIVKASCAFCAGKE